LNTDDARFDQGLKPQFGATSEDESDARAVGRRGLERRSEAETAPPHTTEPAGPIHRSGATRRYVPDSRGVKTTLSVSPEEEAAWDALPGQVRELVGFRVARAPILRVLILLAAEDSGLRAKVAKALKAGRGVQDATREDRLPPRPRGGQTRPRAYTPDPRGTKTTLSLSDDEKAALDALPRQMRRPDMLDWAAPRSAIMRVLILLAAEDERLRRRVADGLRAGRGIQEREDRT
jgi:hypothetical protein